MCPGKYFSHRKDAGSRPASLYRMLARWKIEPLGTSETRVSFLSLAKPHHPYAGGIAECGIVNEDCALFFGASTPQTQEVLVPTKIGSCRYR
jgi:hypothetical protein